MPAEREALLLIVSLAQKGLHDYSGIVARRALYANQPNFDDIRRLIAGPAPERPPCPNPTTGHLAPPPGVAEVAALQDAVRRLDRRARSNRRLS